MLDLIKNLFFWFDYVFISPSYVFICDYVFIPTFGSLPTRSHFFSVQCKLFRCLVLGYIYPFVPPKGYGENFNKNPDTTLQSFMEPYGFLRSHFNEYEWNTLKAYVNIIFNFSNEMVLKPVLNK